MTRTTVRTLTAAMALALPGVAIAQEGHGGGSHDVTLHVSNRWKECSFQLDAALTQSAFRQFTDEAGVVTYFRPMTSARPMGRGRFEFNVVQYKTGISDHDAAWNDTFVHPDSAHWLFEGSGLQFPGLVARVGVSATTDVGLYFTKNPNANYGFVGGQVQQSLVDNADGNWSAAVRGSYMRLFGPDDVDFATYAVDVIASRRYAVLSKRVTLEPYAIMSTSLNRSHEKSAVVALNDESVYSAHGTVGVATQFKAARVGVEYMVSRVPSFSMKIGFGR